MFIVLSTLFDGGLYLYEVSKQSLTHIETLQFDVGDLVHYFQSSSCT